MTRLEKRLTLYMDSTHGTTASSSNVTHTLKEPIETEDNEGLVVRVIHAQVPHVFENVDERHNIINIKLLIFRSGADDGDTYTYPSTKTVASQTDRHIQWAEEKITIPTGQYTGSGLALAFGLALKTHLDGLSMFLEPATIAGTGVAAKAVPEVRFTWDVSMTYDTELRKFTLEIEPDVADAGSLYVPGNLSSYAYLSAAGEHTLNTEIAIHFETGNLFGFEQTSTHGNREPKTGHTNPEVTFMTGRIKPYSTDYSNVYQNDEHHVARWFNFNNLNGMTRTEFGVERIGMTKIVNVETWHTPPSQIRCVHIHSNLATNSVIDSYTGRRSSVVAVIPIDKEWGQHVFLSPSNSVYSSLITTHSISNINVWLTDEHNQELTLGSHPFTIGMEFQWVRINILQKDIKDIRDRRAFAEAQQKSKQITKKKSPTILQKKNEATRRRNRARNKRNGKKGGNAARKSRGQRTGDGADAGRHTTPRERPPKRGRAGEEGDGGGDPGQ